MGGVSFIPTVALQPCSICCLPPGQWSSTELNSWLAFASVNAHATHFPGEVQPPGQPYVVEFLHVKCSMYCAQSYVGGGVHLHGNSPLKLPVVEVHVTARQEDDSTAAALPCSILVAHQR